MSDRAVYQLFQIDTFTDTPFSGNPAAVCPLPDWIDDALMQNIAAENNLSETAFFVGADGSYDLRWFTPVTEVDLCGHATLASGYVIFNELEPHLEEARFRTRSGELIVRRDSEELVMDFPSQPPAPCVVPPGLAEGLRAEPSEVLASADLFAVFESEAQVRAITPKFSMLKRMPFRGVIVTAPGDDCDFVSRFFAPHVGVDEDPVTGSAHCALAPYWAQRLDKRELLARQVSSRGGTIRCAVNEDRVFISGQCTEYLKGEILVGGSNSAGGSKGPALTNRSPHRLRHGCLKTQ